MVGAGTGASAGQLKGGIGSASAVLGDGTTVAALVVVNPFGSTVDPETGELYAARFGLDGEFPVLTAPSEEDVRAARDRALTLPARVVASHPVLATTIGVIATDATLTKAQCAKVAGIGHDGMARAIRPVHTMFDGDTLFTLATGVRPAPGPPQLHGLLDAAADCVTRAIGHAVLAAETVQTPVRQWRSYRDALPLRVPRCHNGSRRRRARVSGQFTPQWPDGLPVGDEWVPAPQQADIRFPYDGSLVASAPVGDAATAGRALDHAVALRDAVGRLPSHVRRAALSGAHRALAARRTEVEQLLVLETGKPLVDCRTEVDRTLLTLQTSAEEVARLHGETVPLDLLPSGEGLVGFWVRKPVGVVVGIAGYNYPLLLAAHKVAPALAAGCPVIVKPAPQTPLATLWMVHVLREALVAAGGPAGAVQLVTGGVDVGVRLTTDRRIGAVSFTGSAAVGHQIARDAAPTTVLLELGSNAAVVVAEDADLDAAADAVIRGGYYASGQACISVQRVIVDRARARPAGQAAGRPDRRGRRR